MTGRPAYVVPTMDEILAVPWNGLWVASTFAGVGGSCLGYRVAGFRVAWANDNDRHALATYRLNAEEHTHVDGRSVNGLDARGRRVSEPVAGADVLAHVPGGVLHVLDGSPPCQAFSPAGKLRPDDARAELIFEFVRLVGETRPLAFVMEEVDLRRGWAKVVLLRLLSELRAMGYDVAARVLKAERHDVPQTRHRLFVVGFRRELGADPRQCFPPQLPYLRAFGDAVPHVDTLARRARRPWGREVEAYHADEPAPTVTASGLSDTDLHSTWAVLADGSRREPPDIADVRRLSSFPEDFRVPPGTRVEREWAGYGNAVPPLLMRAVAERVADALRTLTTK